MTYPQIASFEADTDLPFHRLVVAYIAVVQIVVAQIVVVQIVVAQIVVAQIVVVDFAAQIGLEQTAVADLDQPVRKLEIVVE